MSSGQQIPPWLQEQLAKMQQSQQNLQSIMAQKQQLEIEQLETKDLALRIQEVSKEIARITKDLRSRAPRGTA